MIISDMHTHTRYSVDSKARMEDYCENALKTNVGIICFTEHVDFNENDTGYGFYDPEAYFKEFDSLKEKYAGKLELLSGIEFSEPHLYGNELERLKKYPYDFILGSVHFFYNGMFPSEMAKKGLPAELIYDHYWEEVLKMVLHGGFDCAAHLDFPKRYFDKLIYDEEKISEIFSVMIDRGICLEINTSNIRRDKSQSEAMPDRELLSIYRSLGGRNVTIGSDAHFAQDLAADFEYARSLAETTGLDTVVFRQRNMEK